MWTHPVCALLDDLVFGFSQIGWPHPTLSKGEGLKDFFKVSPFGGDLRGFLTMTRF